jgi:hypothetical protein
MMINIIILVSIGNDNLPYYKKLVDFFLSAQLQY